MPLTDRKRWHAVLDRLPDGVDLYGAEIGVWRGMLSKHLLRARSQLWLDLVDPYKAGTPGSAWWESGAVMARLQQWMFHDACKRAHDVCQFAGDRAAFHLVPSLEAAPAFRDASMDFVFLDGDNSYAGVRSDVEAWLPKLRCGGWIGGRGYGDFKDGRVSEAVHDCFPDRLIETDAESTWFLQIKAPVVLPR